MQTPNARWYDGDGRVLRRQVHGRRLLPRHAAVRHRAARPGARDARCSSTRSRAVHAAAELRRVTRRSRPTGTPIWTALLDDLADRRFRAAVGSIRRCTTPRHSSRAHRPPPVPLTLVHGDCQPANVLVPDERRGAGHRLGVRPHRRSARGPRLLQPPARPAEPVRGGPGRLPRPLPRAHRPHRGAGEPATPSRTSTSSASRGCSGRWCAPPTRSRVAVRAAPMALYLLNGISATTARFVEIAHTDREPGAAHAVTTHHRTGPARLRARADAGRPARP